MILLTTSAGPTRKATGAAPRSLQAFPAGALAPGTVAIVAVLLLAMWIATHPYFGVIHDARLYSVQALNALYPQRFASDLFFKYGSQDSFSAYTSLYMRVVGALGLANADLAATMLGELIWLASAAWLARALFRNDVEFLAAITAVILMQSGYGGEGVFAYGEPFATPRLFAEGLVMAAFALALRRRFALAAISIGIAAALHPLMAAGGGAVIALVAARSDRRVWFVMGAVGCLGLAAVAAGVGPLGRALVSFDPAWFAIVKKSDNLCLITQWRWQDLCRTAATLGALCVADRMATPAERGLIVSVGIASVAALGLSLIGADLLHNLLAFDLQIWRVLWITTLAANAFLAIIVLRLPAERYSKEYLAAAIVFAIGARFDPKLEIIATLLLLLAVAILFREQATGARLTAPWRIVARVAVGAAVVGLGLIVAFDAGHNLDFAAVAARAGVAFAASGLLFWLLRRGPKQILAPASALLVVSGLALADERDPWRQYALAPPSSDGLAAFVPKTGTVYWEGDGGRDVLWFKLHQPEYYSCVQRAGVMFYRGTAMDYARRGKALSALNTRDFADSDGGGCETKRDPGTRGPTEPAQLTAVCRGLPDLDTIILDRAVPGAAAVAWRAPVAQTYGQENGSITAFSTYYRYSCRDLR